MRKYLIAVLILAFTLGMGKLAFAADSPGPDSPGKSEAPTIERRSETTNLDVDIQTPKSEQGQRGPEGVPGPQGAPGPAGASGGTFLGMDSTVALLVGLAILLVAIIAIVAASRGGREYH